jgi:hypothetical protein
LVTAIYWLSKQLQKLKINTYNSDEFQTVLLRAPASGNPRGSTLMFRSIHMLSCVQCLCSQSVNKPNNA